MKPHAFSIWFLIGLQFFLYGLLIMGAGIYGLFHPPEQTVVLGHLHSAIWWGGVMLVLGLFYIVKFRPK